MPVSVVVLLISVATVWLMGHQIVRHRFAKLKVRIPDSYQSAFIAPPCADDPPQLVALCVDLLRKEHCTVPFEALSPFEQKMVLHTLAIEALPQWMSGYATLWLSPQNRRLIQQLRDIKTSRPERRKQHFGAIKHQQQLRSAQKG